MNDVPGYDLIGGQSLRGYTRSKQDYHAHIMLCHVCNEPASAKRYTASALRMLAQIKGHATLLRELRESTAQSEALSKKAKGKRFLFVALSRAMLANAKSKVLLMSKNHKAQYPDTWAALLNLKQRRELYTLFASVLWRNTMAERPLAHMDKPAALPAHASTTPEVVHDVVKKVRRSKAQAAQAAQAALVAEEHRLTSLRHKREMKQAQEAARPLRPWQVRAWGARGQ